MGFWEHSARQGVIDGVMEGVKDGVLGLAPRKKFQAYVL